MRYLKPALIVLGIAIVIALLYQFGPWNLRVPWPFVRFFLMAVGAILTLLALSLAISYLINGAYRRNAKLDRERFAQAPLPLAAVAAPVIVEQPVIIETPVEWIPDSDVNG